MKSVLAFLGVFMGISNACAENWAGGTWRYALESAGGRMIIDQCDDHHCHISFDTSYGAHTCELDDEILNIYPDRAVVKINDDFIHDCTITLAKKYADVIDVSCDGDCYRLCGMSGQFTGRWENENRPQTYRAGFDCDLARGKTEWAICRNANLAAMDREMNILYRRASGQRAAQKNWITRRQKCDGDVGCLDDVYQLRLRDLVTDLSGHEFSLYDYVQLVIDNDFFHPRHAVILENYIRDHIGDETYDRFATCASHFSAHTKTSDYLFGAYGCPGMYTLMESAAYIATDGVWMAFIDYDADNKPFIALYGPIGRDAANAPVALGQWMDDLQQRIKSPCPVVFHDRL